MGLFPIFMKLDCVPCLVVGGGTVAERKVKGLLNAAAHVTVIAPEATQELQSLAISRRISWLKKSYRSGDIEGYRLAIAATDSREINRLVYEEAMECGVLLNSVDDPEHSSFFVPAVARKGSLILAISTSGTAPYLARRLREYLESKLYGGLERDLARAQAVRARILDRNTNTGDRREVLEHELQSLVSEIINKIETS